MLNSVLRHFRQVKIGFRGWSREEVPSWHLALYITWDQGARWIDNGNCLQSSVANSFRYFWLLCSLESVCVNQYITLSAIVMRQIKHLPHEKQESSRFGTRNRKNNFSAKLFGKCWSILLCMTIINFAIRVRRDFQRLRVLSLGRRLFEVPCLLMGSGRVFALRNMILLSRSLPVERA